MRSLQFVRPMYRSKRRLQPRTALFRQPCERRRFLITKSDAAMTGLVGC